MAKVADTIEIALRCVEGLDCRPLPTPIGVLGDLVRLTAHLFASEWILSSVSPGHRRFAPLCRPCAERVYGTETVRRSLALLAENLAEPS